MYGSVGSGDFGDYHKGMLDYLPEVVFQRVIYRYGMAVCTGVFSNFSMLCQNRHLGGCWQAASSIQWEESCMRLNTKVRCKT